MDVLDERDVLGWLWSPSGPFCLNWDLWDQGDLWDFVVADEEGLRWVGVFPLCPSDISP